MSDDEKPEGIFPDFFAKSYRSWDDLIREYRERHPNCEYCGARQPEDPNLNHVCAKMSAEFIRSVRALGDVLSKSLIYDRLDETVRIQETLLDQDIDEWARRPSSDFVATGEKEQE